MMKLFLTLFVAILSLTIVSSAEACSVCFGAKGHPVTEAAGGAILFMVVVIQTMLASIIFCFYRITRTRLKVAISDEQVLQVIQPQGQMFPVTYKS